MVKVYFDNVLIDEDSYTALSNDYKLFTDNFKLGSVASDSFKLSVNKAMVENHPNEVKIEDDNTAFYLVVDSITEDKYVYTYSLTDKLLNFNFDYDASVLINSKAELEEDCYLSDIWHDMCLQANVEYDETYVFENDIVVNWYDSRVQARKYLSFIAELQSGYACMLENGKQSFKKHKKASVRTIDADECSDLIVGEKKTITRVVYDGGAFKWEFGDGTGDTLYLQSDNVFIVNEDIVENIYNNIKDFEFYIIDVPNAPMDSSVRAGDIITISDNGVMYPTIAQYSMSYAGSWSGGYKLQVNTERQQETQITRTSQQVRNIQTKVDRLNNEFSVIAEEIEKLTDYIKNVGTTGGYLMLPDTPKSGGAINTLSIKGFELMPLYPGMAYPSEYTYPGALSFYTLIFDTMPTFDNNPHYIYINSPIPLQKLGSVHDELIIEANKVKVIQRIGYDFDNEQWSVLSSPITHELNDVLLPTFDGDTYISVKYFDNLIFNAEYIIKNDLTSNFATQLESSTQYRQNQNEIDIRAKKDELISLINLSPEEVKIQGSKIAKIKAPQIELEGLTTINDNFKVLLDGSIEANNGLFRGNVKVGDTDLVDKDLGLLTTFMFPLIGELGNYVGWTSGTEMKYQVGTAVIIPTNFQIVSAKLFLKGNKTEWFDDTTSVGFATANNVKLKKDPTNYWKLVMYSGFGYKDYSFIDTEALGVSGVTVGGSSGTEHIVDIGISCFNTGFNYFLVETDMPMPSTETNRFLTEVKVDGGIQITGYSK